MADEVITALSLEKIGGLLRVVFQEPGMPFPTLEYYPYKLPKFIFTVNDNDTVEQPVQVLIEDKVFVLPQLNNLVLKGETITNINNFESNIGNNFPS